MAGTSLRDRLLGIIAEIGEVDDLSLIKDDSDLFADLGLDSMQAMEILLEMERQFDLNVPEESLKEVRSLADAVRIARAAGAKDS